MAIRRVAEVAIAVPRLAAALPLYRDLLALSPDQESPASMRFPVGGSAVRLLEEPPAESGAISYLAFEVDELPAGLAPGEVAPRERYLGLGVAFLPPAPAAPVGSAGPVRCIDHVVIASSDSGATAKALSAALGFEIRRTMTRPGTGAHLEFAKLGDVILEFAGPPEPRPGELRARYWGIVFAVRGLDELVARHRAVGGEATDPRPAVQPGARIATLKSGTAGVPIALIEYGEGS